MSIETITLGAGCFWCVENIFARVHGVVSVTSGYADGNIINPSYQQVINGIGDHAEVVQIAFEPSKLSIETILSVFFAIHDPTTLNRQGSDIGRQYRSTILCHNIEQQVIAEREIAKITAEQHFSQPIVTVVKTNNNFYRAESYHQDFVSNNPENKYCQLVVAQKIQRFVNDFSHLLKDETPLATAV